MSNPHSDQPLIISPDEPGQAQAAGLTARAVPAQRDDDPELAAARYAAEHGVPLATVRGAMIAHGALPDPAAGNMTHDMAPGTPRPPETLAEVQLAQIDQSGYPSVDDRLAFAQAHRGDVEAPIDVNAYAAFAGLDLSLTATGVAVSRLFQPVVLSLVRTDPKDYRSARDVKDRPVATYADRLNRLEDILAAIENDIPPRSLVFLEAPSYGSASPGTFDRSGLWWLTYQRLTAMGSRVIPVAPTVRMLYATGKGRADKDQVLSAVVKRYHDLQIRDNNVADAVVLMAMAHRAGGHPVESNLAAANLRAMDKLEAL